MKMNNACHKEHTATVAGQDYTIRIHTSFADVELQWYSLQQASDVYVFQTFDWLSVWQQILGEKQGWYPCLIEVCLGEQTVMLCPLGVRQERVGRVLSFLGGEVTDYNAPVLDREAFAQVSERDFQVLWNNIVGLIPDVDLVRLHRMPVLLNGIANPVVHLKHMSQTEQAHAAILPATFDIFKQTRSKKMFSDTRRKLRQLAEFGDVDIDVAHDSAQRQAMIDVLAQQKSRRWNETGSRDLFKEQEYLAFYRHLADSGIENGEMFVVGLRVADQWIATRWAICYGGRLCSMLAGFEGGKWAQFSPGRLLLDGTIQWCIEHHLKVFDLSVGDEGYKLQWTDQILPLSSGSYGITLRGKMVVSLQRVYRFCHQYARNIRWLRMVVRRLRGQAPASDQ